MSQYPKYDFTNPNLNYDEVLDTAFRIYSDLLAKEGCCVQQNVDDAINRSTHYLFIAPFDKINNTVRYKADAKSAYLLLYSVI